MADAGYESLENYLYLEDNGQLCFIKPSNYEQKKTKKFQKQVGRIENMAYDPEEDSFTCAQGSFTCAQGRKLHLRRETTEVQGGRLVSTAWYRCEDCGGCPPRAQCCRAIVDQRSLIFRKLPPFQLFQAEKSPPQIFSILRRAPSMLFCVILFFRPQPRLNPSEVSPEVSARFSCCVALTISTLSVALALGMRKFLLPSAPAVPLSIYLLYS